MIQYLVKINLQSPRVMYTDMELTAGDFSAYQLVFTFYSNGTMYPLKNHSVVVKAKRADGKVIIDQGQILETGQGVCTLKSNVYAVPGTLALEVALGNENGGYVTTKELILQVRQGFGEGNLSGENTTPILAKLMEHAAKAEQAAKKAEKISNLTVSAMSLAAEEFPVVMKEESENGIHFSFGIPKGEKMQYSDLSEAEKDDLTKDCVKKVLYAQEMSAIGKDMGVVQGRLSALEENVGNIEIALDRILEMQNELVGGDAS